MAEPTEFVEEIEVELSRPYKSGGEEIRVVRLREPTVQDNLSLPKGDAEATITLLTRCCTNQLPPGFFRGLTLRDFNRLNTRFIESFLDGDG